MIDGTITIVIIIIIIIITTITIIVIIIISSSSSFDFLQYPVLPQQHRAQVKYVQYHGDHSDWPCGELSIHPLIIIKR
jgi:flagellar basal body-associated protein FliL